MDEARKLQFKLNELFDLMIGRIDFPEGFRIGMEVRGFRMGLGRQPLSAVQKAECRKLKDNLKSLIEKII